jgi:hypothetical protein
MTRRAISVTLEADNLTWLKGRSGASGASVSRLLDQIITAARQGAHGVPTRSVVGTIDIDASDPLLEHADALVRAAFDVSLGRPLTVHERRASYGPRTRKSARRRG